MTLIVEDGTGLPTAESYASVAFADAYHTAFGNTTWTGADSEKEIALRKATQYLDTEYSFVGSKKLPAQALEWPRVGYSIYRIWPEVNVQRACCEVALRALAGELREDGPNELITRETIGPLTTHYAFKDNVEHYPIVDKLLRELSGGGGMYLHIGLTG